jgi:hypothetical protein
MIRARSHSISRYDQADAADRLVAKSKKGKYLKSFKEFLGMLEVEKKDKVPLNAVDRMCQVNHDVAMLAMHDSEQGDPDMHTEERSLCTPQDYVVFAMHTMGARSCSLCRP